MTKTIKSGLMKAQFFGGTYFHAKVVYANEFDAQGFERVGGKKIENEMDIPDGQYHLYRKGVDHKYRKSDEWHLVYEGDRPEARKQVKLSKTMLETMDKLHRSDWYYQHNGKTCEYFANDSGLRSIGFEGSGIVEGGYVYTRMSSSTLKALEKRGLIEVAYDGKWCLDAVKVVDMELPKRLENALLVRIIRDWDGHIQEFDTYATSRDAIKHLISYLDSPPAVIVTSVKIIGEVDLTVWDFFKNKTLT